MPQMLLNNWSDVASLLRKNRACDKGYAYLVGSHETVQDAWDECQRGDWMGWLCNVCGPPDAKLVSIHCKLAEPSVEAVLQSEYADVYAPFIRDYRHRQMLAESGIYECPAPEQYISFYHLTGAMRRCVSSIRRCAYSKHFVSTEHLYVSPPQYHPYDYIGKMAGIADVYRTYMPISPLEIKL